MTSTWPGPLELAPPHTQHHKARPETARPRRLKGIEGERERPGRLNHGEAGRDD